MSTALSSIWMNIMSCYLRYRDYVYVGFSYFKRVIISTGVNQ